MIRRLHAAVLTQCLLASSVLVAAQAGGGPPQAVPGAAASSNTITFTVPVNLTQLLPDVTRVRVGCEIHSVAITVNRQSVKGQPPGSGPGIVSNSVEVPVSGGQVVTTATVVVSVAGVLEDPVGKAASAICFITGYSNSLQRWVGFNHCQSNGIPDCTEAAFRVTPPAFQLNNTVQFTW
jgi:hypothetical protein